MTALTAISTGLHRFLIESLMHVTRTLALEVRNAQGIGLRSLSMSSTAGSSYEVDIGSVGFVVVHRLVALIADKAHDAVEVRRARTRFEWTVSDLGIERSIEQYLVSSATTIGS